MKDVSFVASSFAYKKMNVYYVRTDVYIGLKLILKNKNTR